MLNSRASPTFGKIKEKYTRASTGNSLLSFVSASIFTMEKQSHTEPVFLNENYMGPYKVATTGNRTSLQELANLSPFLPEVGKEYTWDQFLDLQKKAQAYF